MASSTMVCPRRLPRRVGRSCLPSCTWAMSPLLAGSASGAIDDKGSGPLQPHVTDAQARCHRQAQVQVEEGFELVAKPHFDEVARLSDTYSSRRPRAPSRWLRGAAAKPGTGWPQMGSTSRGHKHERTTRGCLSVVRPVRTRVGCIERGWTCRASSQVAATAAAWRDFRSSRGRQRQSESSANCSRAPISAPPRADASNTIPAENTRPKSATPRRRTRSIGRTARTRRAPVRDTPWESVRVRPP